MMEKIGKEKVDFLINELLDIIIKAGWRVYAAAG